MKTKIKLLSVVLFSVAFTSINAQDKNIYLEYDKVTGEQSFYLDYLKKEPFKEITPSILKEYDNIEVTVYNLKPSVNQLIFSLLEDKEEDDELDMTFMTSILKNAFSMQYFYNAGSGMSLRGESSSKNVFEIAADKTKDNSEVLSLLFDKKKEYDNIRMLYITLQRLEAQNYPFQTLKEVFYQYVKEFNLTNFISKRMDDDYINTKFNILNSDYFISTSLVDRYYETKEETEIISSRGSTEAWKVKTINYRNTKIEEELLPFFENDSNLELVLDNYAYIVNFQDNLKEKNYTKTVLVPLDESYGKVWIRSYSDGSSSNADDVFTFSVNPKAHFKVSTSFGISFSKFMNDKLEVVDTSYYSYSFKDVAQEDYFPSLGSFMNFGYIKPNKIYNLGLATGIVIPLQQNSSPSIVIGPTIAIGKERNKIHVNFLYGLSPTESYSREDIEVDHVYDGYFGNSDFEEKIRYEPTMSIGISWGI